MLLAYWKKQTGKEKLFIIIIGVLLIFGVYIYIKYEISRYRLIRTQKEQLGVYKDSLEITKQQLTDYILTGEEINRKARRNSNKISNKFKNDTEKINSSTVTDNELLEFLSEYERKAVSQ